MHQSGILRCDKCTTVTQDVNSRGDGVRVHHNIPYYICNFSVNLKLYQNKNYFKIYMYIPGENRNSRRHMHSNVHCSTIHNRRTWKQPKCSSTEEWIKKTWYIYTMEQYSAIKRNEIVPFAEMWVDPETVIQSKSEREKQIQYNVTYTWNL